MVYRIIPFQNTLEVFSVPIFLGLVIAAAFSVFANYTTKVNIVSIFKYYAAFGLPISIVAYIAGILTGLSRAPALGNVLPAILALIAGLNVYVFGTDNRYKVVVGYSVIILSFMLYLGIETGATLRERQREDVLINLSQKEYRVRNFRRNLELPQDMPDWLFIGDGK